MSFPEFKRFDFHRNGHGNRRDTDALPRVLVLAMDLEDHELHFHLAGDEFQRVAHVFDAVMDRDLVAGLEPEDAMRLGIEFQRARWRAYGE